MCGLGMPHHPVYLWTLPIVPLQRLVLSVDPSRRLVHPRLPRRVEAPAVFDAIRQHRVTHYCGAPIVHSMLISAPENLSVALDHR